MQANARAKQLIYKYIGDRAFLKMLITIAVPLIIQQGITSAVNLLDNVMVGALGTEAISGVAIVNQLIFVFNLTIFGGLSGASIFGAQFAGRGDYEGVRHAFRYKLILGLIVSALAGLAFSFRGEQLIKLYLSDTANDASSIALTLSEAKDYLAISIWGLLPFAISQCYGSSLRETGETLAPMAASAVSITVNLVFNYILIYGKLGAPALGVRGAAIATILSRYVETAYLLFHTYRHTDRYPFVPGALKSLYIPGTLVKRILKTGTPLIINEFFWSTGMAIINQCYSVRGLETVAAVNIATTVWNVFSIVMFAIGNTLSILVGQRLGAGDVEGAKETDRRLITIDTLVHAVIGLAVILLSGVIPRIYNVEPAVRALTSSLLIIEGLAMPIHAPVHAMYFTIRSGGRTILTMLFDSVFVWVAQIPLAALLCYRTSLPVAAVYAVLQFVVILKLIGAAPLMRSGAWARVMIDKDAPAFEAD